MDKENKQQISQDNQGEQSYAEGRVLSMAAGGGVFLLILVILFISLNAELIRRKSISELELITQGDAIRTNFLRELNSVLYLSSGLKSYLLVKQNNIVHQEMQDILMNLYGSSQHIRNFGVAVGLRLQYVYPLEGNESAIGLYYPDNPEQWKDIQKAIDSNTPLLVGPVSLVQGGMALIYRVPIYQEGQYWGLMSTVIDADSLLDAVFSEVPLEDIRIAIRKREPDGTPGFLMYGEEELFDREDLVKVLMNVPGRSWEVALADKEDRAEDLWILFAFVPGLAFAVMMGYGSYLLLNQRSQLKVMALFDHLTGLPNRYLYMDRLMLMTTRWQREQKGAVVILFLDLDGFKNINDQYGHKAGDLVLRATAKRLQKQLRAVDIICRWGGDEFLIAGEIESKDYVPLLISRIREEAEQPIPYKNSSLQIGLSIGSALFPGDEQNIEELIRLADEMMYKDKVRRKSSQD